MNVKSHPVKTERSNRSAAVIRSMHQNSRFWKRCVAIPVSGALPRFSTVTKLEGRPMSLRRLMVVLIAVVAGLGPPAAVGAETLTDPEKLAAVYRMYAQYRQEFSAVKDIAPAAAMAKFTAGTAVFVDTRKPAEIAVSKIPGAVTEEKFLEAPDRHAAKTVIGYCTISYRSGLFAEKMAERGIEMVNPKGGILAWTLEGGPVVDPEGNVVRRLHVYGKEWNYAPEGYEVEMFGWLDRLLSQRPRQMLRDLQPLPRMVSPTAGGGPRKLDNVIS